MNSFETGLAMSPASCKVIINGQLHTFDKFAKAINFLLPQCASCGTRMIGHGMDLAGRILCDQCLIEADKHNVDVVTNETPTSIK